MGKFGVPYLVSRPNRGGGERYYFQAQGKHTDVWPVVRLHDRYEQPITDKAAAEAACRKIVEVYAAWRTGEADAGPHRIDRLGRVLPLVRVPAVQDAQIASPEYLPGQIGAMIADFLAHPIFLEELGEKTQAEYRTYLRLFAEKFGHIYWHKLSPGAVRAWLVQRAKLGGASGAHALYRTARAFLGKIRLCYEDVDHPGVVPEHANPLVSLSLSLPQSQIRVWPRAAVDAFVDLADRAGHPSIGDAIVIMSWLGVRRLDWLPWGADTFDRDILAFRQKKTDIPVVLPWSMVPALVDRVTEAKRRRDSQAVAATTFFHDAHGRPWKSAAAFRQQFNRLRDELERQHPTFPTRYYVGLVPGDPLSIPTSELTMRTMRHTCVTLNHDAGISRELIGSITGHSPESIDEVIAHYMARTADQAEAALNQRLVYERNPGRVRRKKFGDKTRGSGKRAAG